MKIGLIGFGRLGRLIAEYLQQDADLLIYDVEDYKEEIRKIGATPASLKEACQCPVVIPFVPISAFEELLNVIKDFINKDALIIDVCSVKSLPVKWMEEKLPKSVSILGTHPMFGPDSAKDTLFGRKIVLCPVRIENKTLSNIKSYFEGNGLKVIEAGPEEHDRQIAHSLLLTHFVGRSLMDFGAKPLDIDTKGYRRLMKILQTVENDTWQLFEDMNKYNPFSQSTRQHFMDSLNSINGKIKK